MLHLKILLSQLLPEEYLRYFPAFELHIPFYLCPRGLLPFAKIGRKHEHVITFLATHGPGRLNRTGNRLI